MKLHLDNKNLANMILTVSEVINPRDAQILRAGFKKLLHTARQTFLVDLTNATIEKEAEFTVLALHIEAIKKKIRLVIVGKNDRVCQAKKLSEGQGLLTAVMRLDKVLVPQLYLLHKNLNFRRQKALATLGGDAVKDWEADPAGAEEAAHARFEMTIAENQRLKVHVDALETEIGFLVKDHQTPVPLGALEEEQKKVDTLVTSELDVRGVLSHGEVPS